MAVAGSGSSQKPGIPPESPTQMAGAPQLGYQLMSPASMNENLDWKQSTQHSGTDQKCPHPKRQPDVLYYSTCPRFSSWALPSSSFIAFPKKGNYATTPRNVSNYFCYSCFYRPVSNNSSLFNPGFLFYSVNKQFTYLFYR